MPPPVAVDAGVPESGSPGGYDGGPLACAQYGQACTANGDCCNGVACNGGFCYTPVN
jgi:hypothetical protein